MRELRLLVFPHAVHPVRLGERVLEGEVVANLLVFGSLFVALYLVGVLTLAACGYDLATTLSAPASAICNVGPGLGKVGPTTHWGHLPDAAKWVMSALMLLGRLEIYSILVLATPWAWKR
jgi:trk system potassium uptake protein TrkH